MKHAFSPKNMSLGKKNHNIKSKNARFRKKCYRLGITSFGLNERNCGNYSEIK